MGELIHQTEFYPQSPNEAEQFLRQFVELYSNNDPLNSTVQLGKFYYMYNRFHYPLEKPLGQEY